MAFSESGGVFPRDGIVNLTADETQFGARGAMGLPAQAAPGHTLPIARQL